MSSRDKAGEGRTFRYTKHLGIQHVGFSMLKATGSVGGAIVLWNTNSFQSSCGDFSITCFLQSVERSFFWAFTGIYGPH